MPEIITDIEQGTPEWHALRVGRFTASRFGCLIIDHGDKWAVTKEGAQRATKVFDEMQDAYDFAKAQTAKKGERFSVEHRPDESLHKGMTDYIDEIATEILTGRSAEESSYKGTWVAHGNETENEARAAYEFHANADVETVTFIVLNDRVGCSPDGLVGDDGAIEIKCTKLSTHLRYLAMRDCPPEHRAQVQGVLWITGRQWCDFISYCPVSHRELHVIRVLRDEAYIEKLAEHVEAAAIKAEQRAKQLETIAA